MPSLMATRVQFGRVWAIASSVFGLFTIHRDFFFMFFDKYDLCR